MAKGIKTGGRKKGTPNKISRDIREAVLQSFATVGGAAYLAEQARANPTAYLSLVGKVLPLQVTGEDGGAVQISMIERRIVRAGD